MRIQVLLATMNQTDNSILKKMNIQSDIIIGNQCSKNEIKEEKYGSYNVKWLSLCEKGVGLNRNNALMRADAEVGLFADDDVVYIDGYADIVKRFFEQTPEADVVIFNMKVSRDGSPLSDRVKKTKRITRVSAGNYGAFSLAIRTQSIKRANLYFHREFGGGAEYSCGEDTIFLQDCFKKHLKVYTCKDTIGKVYHSPSTWFEGYTEKYLRDKGVLFKYLYPHTYKGIALYHCFKHRKLYNEIGAIRAYRIMCSNCGDANGK